MDLSLTGSPINSPDMSVYSQANTYDSISDSSAPGSPPMSDAQMTTEMLYYGGGLSGFYPPQQNGTSRDFPDSSFPDGDRRRKRTSNSTRQKDSTPQMHLQRRRAQNRASQRAFRERKEKHVKGLEHQLDDLHEKHQDLLHSYSRQSEEMSKLNARIHELSSEIEILRSTNDASLGEMLTRDKLESVPYYFGPDYCFDGGPVDTMSHCAFPPLDDST